MLFSAQSKSRKIFSRQATLDPSCSPPPLFLSLFHIPFLSFSLSNHSSTVLFMRSLSGLRAFVVLLCTCPMLPYHAALLIRLWKTLHDVSIEVPFAAVSTGVCVYRCVCVWVCACLENWISSFLLSVSSSSAANLNWNLACWIFLFQSFPDTSLMLLFYCAPLFCCPKNLFQVCLAIICNVTVKHLNTL